MFVSARIVGSCSMMLYFAERFGQLGYGPELSGNSFSDRILRSENPLPDLSPLNPPDTVNLIKSLGPVRYGYKTQNEACVERFGFITPSYRESLKRVKNWCPMSWETPVTYPFLKNGVV